jgi:putative methyltransferase (TIGR04325 family)
VDYANLLASLGNRAEHVLYHVVDTPECCETGRRLWSDDPRITFDPVHPAALERFDVVYSSSVINLIEDWPGLLRKFAGDRPAAILLCKASMYEGPSFVRRQVNMGKGMENPLWALGIGDVTRVMEESGYTLAYRGYGPESYNVDNYEDARKAGRMVNLLFVRKSVHSEPA